MVNAIFSPLTVGSFTIGTYLLCTLSSMALGALVAFTASRSRRESKGYLLTLALLPPVVETVIMMVNGNIGTGVAVMGAFGLVRFRSAPGSAREILMIFLSMAIGLSTAIGYVAVAAVFTLLLCGTLLLAERLPIGSEAGGERELRVTIPESLNYADAFTDIFAKYTDRADLVNAKTTNMGSLFKLRYRLRMKSGASEQDLINELRCRNGNLEIALGTAADGREEF